MFGLKPPAPPPEVAPPPAPERTILLQGITSIMGHRQVLFKVQTPAERGKKAEEQSYILGEGEGKDDIEVVSIDDTTGTVKFKNHGTPQTLDMEHDSAKPTPGAAPAPGSRPGLPIPIPHVSAASRPNPAAGSSVITFGRNNNNNGGSRRIPIPARTPRTQPAVGGYLSASASLSPSPSPSPSASQNPPLTREEQTIMMEVERERTKAQVEAGQLPPLPPTELTPPGAPGMPPAPPGQPVQQ